MSTEANDDDAFAQAMLDALGKSTAKSLAAPQLARLLKPEGDAHELLGAIRKAAVRLAHDGRLVIYRKGKIADPDTFKGTYRLGLPSRS